MSAKNAGFSTYLKKAAAKRRKARQRSAGRCLRAEQLESRQLMTGAAEFLSVAAPLTGPDPVPWQEQANPVDARPAINTLNATAMVSTLSAEGESGAAAATNWCRKTPRTARPASRTWTSRLPITPADSTACAM